MRRLSLPRVIELVLEAGADVSRRLAALSPVQDPAEESFPRNGKPATLGT
jgi:hypothetical protein